MSSILVTVPGDRVEEFDEKVNEFKKWLSAHLAPSKSGVLRLHGAPLVFARSFEDDWVYRIYIPENIWNTEQAAKNMDQFV